MLLSILKTLSLVIIAGKDDKYSHQFCQCPSAAIDLNRIDCLRACTGLDLNKSIIDVIQFCPLHDYS